MLTASIVRVAIDTPLRTLFDYRVPEGAPAPPPGSRVRVPFGRQRLTGVVLELAGSTTVPEERLRALLEVLDPEPIFDAAALELLRWSADYYHHPIGGVVAAALPKALRLGGPARAPAKRARRARGGIGVAGEGEGEGGAGRDRETGPELAVEQALAVEAITASLGRFAAFLLHGITGSGKTEVYLRVIESALGAGRRALVLVPEIGLTPQLISRFEARFATPLVVMHSGRSDAQRLAAWRDAWSGRGRLVLGTRSAVFAPIPDLGVIVVDEEHDPSFKQHEGGFRYSARDLALVRARLAGVPVVLGSATPALETLHNAATGRYQRLSLPRRAADALPPRVALVDLRQHAVKAGLSTPVVQAIARHLAADGQVLVYINRRGYAPTLACTACGWIGQCRDCDARLTVHQSAGRLRCHHCGADAPLPSRCPVCGFNVKAVGQGTERIEVTLGELFPGVGLARLDRDVVRRPEDLGAVMGRVNSGETRMLVGTQMVTKGHHFPGMTLVVVLNADHGLFSTDFRAAERLAQTIVQVAGRAGRGTRPGEVLIQTEFPEHPLLTSLLAEGYDGFARAALAERETAAWPPFSRLAALRSSARDEAAGLDFLREARAAARPPKGLRLLGPVPATLARKAGRYRAQLLIESADRSALQRFLGGWIVEVEALPSARRVRWALDVDPLDLQ